MIRGIKFQIQPAPSPLHCNLENIHIIPSTKCVCVCVCVCVCEGERETERKTERERERFFKSFISQATLHKIHGRYYVERGSVFFMFLLLSLCFFSFFLIRQI